MATESPPPPPAKCSACGGKLALLVEIPPRGNPYEQDHPRTRYFRCDGCAQIQVVDE